MVWRIIGAVIAIWLAFTVLGWAIGAVAFLVKLVLSVAVVGAIGAGGAYLYTKISGKNHKQIR